MNDISTAGTELKAMQIADILKALPHRYPMLMIDRIVEINGDETAIGIKNVTFNEPIFQGHFPDNPIFPGVLIIEGMAQTAGAIVIHHDSNAASEGRKNIVMMLGVDKAKFRKPAGPGDRLEYHIAKIQRRRNVGRYEAKAMVDGVLIAEAEITAMIIEAPL
ncbi:3-hydroxyacyl-ACP dehydratase [Devosia limi DSM 17137]|uniref:3-hydroxyacyl-[acyl-carrier-protein] dehydratase FabZ n=1 Tax=Devosia limi DSM 17137 TaxID=1121477 RepID=A0A0F5LK34_9HYPH|nr:3-hydroxyacyl-ACP dehydratase FabZ [Devosia limi]KKB82776.1 3-hydroxyacyl-ACP dehydratase [Devosia limi DSM 17137]SHF46960.1 3-hydroxyacyl-[acyl-carrier-protein] dehydratase [Devosia limi DSM 17137]